MEGAVFVTFIVFWWPQCDAGAMLGVQGLHVLAAFSGCQNPQCSQSNEVAIQVGPSLHRGKGKGGKTKAFAKKVPPGVERRKRSRERTPSWPACKMLKLASLQDAEVGQGWTDNKDIIDHLKHDPYFVQGEADNKDVDVGQGSADNQDADVGQGSADKSKANKAKKKKKKKKEEDDLSKKPKNEFRRPSAEGGILQS